MGAVGVVAETFDVVVACVANAGFGNEGEPVIDLDGQAEFLPGVKAGEAVIGEEVVDFDVAVVHGAEHGLLVLEFVPDEAGFVLLVDPEGGLTFVDDGGAEDGGLDLIKGELRESLVGLVEVVDSKSGPEGEEAAFLLMDQGQRVVGVGFVAEGGRVEILEVVAVAQVSEIGIEVGGAGGEEVEVDTLPELEPVAVFVDRLAFGASALDVWIEVVEVVKFQPTEVGVVLQSGIEQVQSGGEAAAGKDVGMDVGEDGGVFPFAGDGIDVAAEHDSVAIEKERSPVGSGAGDEPITEFLIEWL